MSWEGQISRSDAEAKLKRALEKRLQLKENGCLEWAGHTSNSYGILVFYGRRWATHRLAWVLQNGPIPENMQVCHKCDNRLCCNTDHLFIGTAKDNQRDAARKGRKAKRWTAECIRGFRARYVPWCKINGCRAMAKAYNVPVSGMYSILARKTWRHLDE